MSVLRAITRRALALNRSQFGGRNLTMTPRRTATTSMSGAFLEEPPKAKLGLAGITVTVTVGLLLGATISKNIAAFLEENELFVPTDDDDDD